jgi:hypothetical protein
MADLSLENIEFIKILANSDSTILQKSMNTATKDRFHSQISVILREYYKENTIGKSTDLIEKFENAGISEDDGKAAIACARRLGLDIY